MGSGGVGGDDEGGDEHSPVASVSGAVPPAVPSVAPDGSRKAAVWPTASPCPASDEATCLAVFRDLGLLPAGPAGLAGELSRGDDISWDDISWLGLKVASAVLVHGVRISSHDELSLELSSSDKTCLHQTKMNVHR